MHCPKCGRKYKHERICPTCHRVLVDEWPASDAGVSPAGAGSDHDVFEPDEGGPASECVFRTKDMGLLPLATMALDSAGIHYMVHRGPDAALLGAGAGLELHVRAADAGEARALLADLEHAGERGLGTFDPAVAVPRDADAAGPPASGAGPGTGPSIALIDADSGWALATVTTDQLEWLGQRLARDEGRFYVDAATLDMLEADGADRSLVDALSKALGDREGIDLRPGSELLFDADGGRRLSVVSEDEFASLVRHGLAAEIELTEDLLERLRGDGVGAGLLDALGAALDDGVTRIAAVKPDQRHAEDTLPLVDTQADRPVGLLTAIQAAWLADRLEPQPVVFGDPDYCIDGDVLAYLEEEGADSDLLGTLRQALAGRDEMFVRW